MVRSRRAFKANGCSHKETAARERLPGRARRPVLRGASLAALACLTMTCSNGRAPTRATSDVARTAFDVRVAVLTDLQGYLEPCGCQSRPLGGIDKLAAKLDQLASERLPMLLLLSGNVFFGGLPAGAQNEAAKAQEIWKAQLLAELLGELGASAVAPGPADLSHGVATLGSLKRTARFPLLAYGESLSSDAAKPEAFKATSLHRLGKATVGVWGLSPLSKPLELPAIERASRKLTARLRGQGAQIVIGLLYAKRRLARRALANIRGLDFVVDRGLEQAIPQPPTRVAGGPVFLSAGRQGHGLVVLDLIRKEEGGFTDVGDWARQRRTNGLARRIADLQRRIAGWEKDRQVNQRDVDRQRRRLEHLLAELREVQAAPQPQGNIFASRWIELAPEIAGKPSVKARVDAYDRRVNAHNRRALADWKPPPAAKGAARYVGSRKCGACHAAAFAWWRTHAHGRAYATLERLDKQFNLSCVGCHVTGYNKPGGSTVVHNRGLTNVGCESCHGPGSRHPAPELSSVTREVAERVCVTCHNEEHSDRFSYPTYRAALLVPGHGKPLKAAE
ncbi:MAG: hypothetical protein MJD61_21045 [Proteobacteria bacterium]|nr:hypothetical protein [Pseudomonadota bacterium]